MKIKATEKAIKECAAITLQGNGLAPELLEQFVAGKTITVTKDIGNALMEHGLATEGGATIAETEGGQ